MLLFFYSLLNSFLIVKNFVLFLSICCSFVLNCNQAYAAKKLSSSPSSDVWKGGKKIRAIQSTKESREKIKKELIKIAQCQTKFAFLTDCFSQNLVYSGYESEKARKVRKQELENAGNKMLQILRNIKTPAMSTRLLTLARTPRSLFKASEEFMQALKSDHAILMKQLKKHKKDTHDSDSEEEVTNKISQMNLKEES